MTRQPLNEQFLRTSFLNGGNAESYVKLAFPERQADVIATIEGMGYHWEPLFEVQPPVPFVSTPTP